MAVLFAPTKANHILYDKHKAIIDKAIDAAHKREFYAQYPEMPSPEVYGEKSDQDQKESFEKQLGARFESLKQSRDGWLESDEQSPYSMKPLAISYPVCKSPKSYIEKSVTAFGQWKSTDAETRAGILVEVLERFKKRFYEVAYATMHTTGQSFMMSFQASGPHAADRALEALALAFQELKRFPEQTLWEKPVGKQVVRLEKFYTTIPKGIALAIGCATFPIWNTLPGVFASLATGNPVIIKPHPKGIYPLAIVISILQEVLVENGFSADLAILACDKEGNLISKDLAEDAEIKIIDFTGSSQFGSYIESLPGKITFTEKAGVNSVIVDSVSDLKAMAQNLAFSVSLYSGQMCTAPQNIFVPRDGIKTVEGKASYDEVKTAIVDAISSLATHPKMGPAILGAIQNEATCARVEEAKNLGGQVLLESKSVDNPEFKELRSASPIIVELNATASSIFSKEMFGPIVFIIPTSGTAESLELASRSAREHGAISCAAYTLDTAMMQEIAVSMAESGTSVSFNLLGNIYVNQSSTFSDFHVSGGNPAGNASLTDPEFVLKRFTRVQARINS